MEGGRRGERKEKGRKEGELECVWNRKLWREDSEMGRMQVMRKKR